MDKCNTYPKYLTKQNQVICIDASAKCPRGTVARGGEQANQNAIIPECETVCAQLPVLDPLRNNRDPTLSEASSIERIYRTAVTKHSIQYLTKQDTQQRVAPNEYNPICHPEHSTSHNHHTNHIMSRSNWKKALPTDKNNHSRHKRRATTSDTSHHYTSPFATKTKIKHF